MSSTNQIMLKNCLRLAVRTGGEGPDAILSIVGAVNTQRYERRRAELAFVEDGVRVAAGEGLDTIALEGWPTLAELVADANGHEIVAYACSDCAGSRGVATDGGAIERTRWVPTEDVHLPLHACSKGKSSESLELRTVVEQQQEQRQFDELVGHVTVGADRGEA
jgi:hypothetical protein